MKKLSKVALIVLVSLSFLGSVCMATDSEGMMKHFSKEEIKAEATERLIMEMNSENEISDLEQLNENNKIRPRGSFYNEYPIRYDAQHTFVDKEAFKVAEFTYDTDGCPTKYKEVEVNYNGGDTVEWSTTIGGSVKGKIWGLVETEVHVDVSRSSTISRSIGSTVPYSLKRNSIAVIPVYAYGYKTTGSVVYKWDDRDGNSGYKYKKLKAYLPYKKYKSSYIKFGRVSYE